MRRGSLIMDGRNRNRDRVMSRTSPPPQKMKTVIRLGLSGQAINLCFSGEEKVNLTMSILMFVGKSSRQAAPCVKGRAVSGDQIGQKSTIRVRAFANKHTWAKSLDVASARSVEVPPQQKHVADRQGGEGFL